MISDVGALGAGYAELGSGGPKEPADLVSLENLDERRRIIQLWILMLTAFVWSCAGNFVNLVFGGRLPADFDSTGNVAQTAIGGRVGTLSVIIGYVVIAALISYNVILKKTKTVIHWPLALILIFFLTVSLANFAASGGVELRIGAREAIALGVALWSIQPKLRDLRVVGAAAFGVALCSFALIPSGRAWMLHADASLLEKAIIGHDLLAGPFPQSNVLGLVLTAGIGFIFMMKHAFWRVVAFVTVGFALLLSGSRTSLIAVAVACVVALVAVLVRSHRGWTTICAVSGLITAAAVFVLPISTHDPAAFTDRGEIWMLSRVTWLSGVKTFLVGNTLSFYGSGSQFSVQNGTPTYHGHNEFVTVMTMSGVIALLLLALIFWLAMRNTLAIRGAGARSGALVLLCLLVASLAETPLRIDTVDSVGWMAWFALFGLLFAAARDANDEASADKLPRPLPVDQPV